VLTPEVTNCVSSSRTHQAQVLSPEADDPTLAMLRDEAARAGHLAAVGSLVAEDARPGRALRQPLVPDRPGGEIVARYDKIHMFDVEVSETETYRESAGHPPRERAVLARRRSRAWA
jgi:deaminated glutathione amidase